MDEVALLRATIRNCTAVLIAAIGIAATILAPMGEARLGAMMAGVAILYLAPTLFVGLGKGMDELGPEGVTKPEDSDDSESVDS